MTEWMPEAILGRRLWLARSMLRRREAIDDAAGGRLEMRPKERSATGAAAAKEAEAGAAEEFCDREKNQADFSRGTQRIRWRGDLF
jgi:hypothetical protein